MAFSGGADSLGLLLLLWAHWPGRRRRLVAMHFNHRLRGAAAAADARFCRRVARALGVAFAAGHWREAPRGAGEAEARAARFDFFEAQMRRRRIRALWLGHQRDDIAESLFMGLARGSGAAGLSAPRPVHARSSGECRIRPLLTLKKAEIARALRKAGIPWREDATNARDAHFRNRVRRRVLPAWVRSSGRDALAGAALSRELLEEDDRALEAWVDELDPVTRGGELSLARLAGRPRAVVRRALRRWLLGRRLSGSLSRQAFEALLAAAQAGRPTRQSLGAGVFALIRNRRVRLEKTG